MSALKRIIFFVSFFIPIACFSSKIIEVIPCDPTLMDVLFAEKKKQSYHEMSFWGKIQYQLKEQGYSIRTTALEDVAKKQSRLKKYIPWMQPKRKVHKLLVFNLPYFIHSRKIYNIPKNKLILFMLEPPTIVPEQYDLKKMKKRFSKIYTFDDSLVDNQQIFHFYYPVCDVTKCRKIPYESKQFLVMIAGNKQSSHPDELYSKRKDAIHYFGLKGLDLYGRGWSKTEFPCYRGAIRDKWDVLQNYRFSICYENIKGMNGYITEKIFDCFIAGCVPIYLGANNIEQYIPKDCFIDQRDFDSFEELELYLKSMTKEQYDQYIHNIDQFLASDQAKKFSTDSFAKLVKRSILDI